ncbi:GntR family transcriptional regulator [Methylomonas sp. LWB]|uniref:GntR family transcriptional regulator n=1 Tax=Methylomonas sp. LWB TaxID=1905845 RepID=UPI0008D8E17A|nr:GntR family transcriptional regulator [Methylomonas sp. LWB]OHX35229.1 GntR family transcriptional regulator [Methylomonas sp. LWB]
MAAIASSDISTGSLAANDSAAFIEKIRPNAGVSEPVYKQLQKRIADMIQSGELADGFSLPSERALAEALALSRTTVRRCYEELRAQDRIASHGRSGAKVKAPARINPEMGKLKGFTEEMRELGITPSTQILEHRVVVDRTIASLFNRPASARFLRLVRVRLGDGMPLSREVAWYDLTVAPALADWDGEGSAYQYLESACDLGLVHAEQTIEAVLCDDVEAAVFGFAEPAPCLLLKRKTHADNGQIVEYVEGTFRGDAYTYRVNLKIRPD